MKILLLLGTFNFPPKNGGDQALINSIDRLKDHVEFHLISVSERLDNKTDLEEFRKAYPEIKASNHVLYNSGLMQRIESHFVKTYNAVFKRLNHNGFARKCARKIYEPGKIRYRNFYRYIENYIEENDIDIVQSEFWFTLGRLIGIKNKTKRVFVQHEIQYVVDGQRLHQREYTESDIMLYGIQRKSEIMAMNKCEAIITLSENDKSRLVKDGVVVPIFSSFAQIKFEKTVADTKNIRCVKLAFVGPESHIPNKQGLVWFFENVWPEILEIHPDVTIDIVGRWSDHTISEWSRRYANVNFLGFVDELKRVLKNSILIVPIFQGSGVRMKIIEACNLGVPVVSTSVGAEGLGLKDGFSAFITDDIENFAADILNLLDSSEVASELVRNANCHIKEHFTDERFVESRMRCYNYLMRGKES